MWTLEYVKFVAMQTLWLRVVSTFRPNQCFNDCSFYQVHTNIRVHFGIRENLSLFSSSRCTFLFFRKSLLCFNFLVSSFFFFRKSSNPRQSYNLRPHLLKGPKDAWKKEKFTQIPLSLFFSFFLVPDKPSQWNNTLSQRALCGRAKARLTGGLSKGGKMRGVTTNVYSWITSNKTEGNRSKWKF